MASKNIIDANNLVSSGSGSSMMEEQGRRAKRIRLISDPTDEQSPLLGSLRLDYAGVGQGGPGDDTPPEDQVYSCVTNPHSHLPVYTTIHRIRRDIISVVEDFLTYEQLRDMKINLTVVRPLVDKFYELDDISISESPHVLSTFVTKVCR
jgi:hypothetical protein